VVGEEGDRALGFAETFLGIARPERPRWRAEEDETEHAVRPPVFETRVAGDRAPQRVHHPAEAVVSGRRLLAGLQPECYREPVVAPRVVGEPPAAPLRSLERDRHQGLALLLVAFVLDSPDRHAGDADEGFDAAVLHARGAEVGALRGEDGVRVGTAGEPAVAFGDEPVYICGGGRLPGVQDLRPHAADRRRLAQGVRTPENSRCDRRRRREAAPQGVSGADR
jgi:hypothetical protein